MSFTTETYTIQGMKQDMSELLSDKNFAFENKNIRLIVEDTSTNAVVVQERGNKKLNCKITEKFFTETSNLHFLSEFDSLPFVILGHCEVDKYLVLFGKVIENTVVGNITFTAGNDIVLRLELQDEVLYGWLIYNDNELNFGIEHPIETIGNVETNLVKKVYFVDGINVPRVVNVVLPNAGELANFNLGYYLNLNDVFTVEKTYNQVGNYPMGKIRFFYTYSNDLNSESNIVDWSPFFDCNYENQGGSVDSSYKTQFAFRVHIENLDTQFKYIRIYSQHFTQADPNVYEMKYCERNIQGLSEFSEIITWDEFDAVDSTITYLDKKIGSYTFIPYTFAEKNNRLFYGNIKKSLPSVKDINLENAKAIKFDYKLIGTENLTSENVYQYESNNTTFKGSNYDYMGFRKTNWYRFGFIAQYYTGEWSEVMFIGDKQCNISSKTEITYNDDNVPQRSKYYIPYAYINVASLLNPLKELYALGYKRIKPVCVIPPPAFRDVITQGISCATLYNGGARLKNSNNHSLFAIPSFFFRPTPLYNTFKTKTEDGVTTFDPNYSFTIRNLSDLILDGNIKSDNNSYLLNPTFDKDYDNAGVSLINYNDNFREYRHAMSLPPKDVIQAELQSSDFSLHDYFYKKASDESLWNLLNSVNGVDLYNTSSSSSTSDYFRIIDPTESEDYEMRYGRMPAHSVYTSGYANTMFVDESILTLNSPEIDYNFSEQVEPFYLNQLIDVVGYAQVTGSQMDVDIPATTFKQTTGAPHVDTDALYNVQGKCLFNLDSTVLGDTDEIIKNIKLRNKLSSNVMPLTSGPWWFDTMLVSSFKRFVFGTAKWWNYEIIPNNNFDISDYVYDNENVTIHDHGYVWRRQYHDNTIGTATLTTTFFGETNKHLGKEDGLLSVERTNGSLFYVPFKESNEDKIGFALFTDDYCHFLPSDVHNIGSSISMVKKLMPLTVSTLRKDDESDNQSDAFWTNYFRNRQIDYLQLQSLIQNNIDIFGWYLGLSTYHFSVFGANDFDPWLLPHTSRFELQNIIDPNFNKLNGSVFGCHYYFPYSTNFTSSVFEPIYPHTIYPFMTTSSFGGETPFCGSSDIYRQNEGNVRPEYNKTSSFLYSNCTNYVNVSKTKYKHTYSAYYCSPNITQERRSEPDLNDIPFFTNNTNSYWYSFKYNDSTIKNVPVLHHRTYTLTPAMKWYRGFKNWGVDETSTVASSTLYKISNGNYFTKSAILGNLFFSGTFPQFIVKRGTLSYTYSGISDDGITDLRYVTQYRFLKSENGSKLKDVFDNDALQNIELDYNTLPHIVYYSGHNDRILNLLPHIQFSNDDSNSLFNQSVSFEPSFYYKEFIPNMTYSNRPWQISAYPHTGHFEQLEFSYLSKSTQPFWNRDNWLQTYPSSINQTIIETADNKTRYIKYDGNGKPRRFTQTDLNGNRHISGNIWILPISNMYNTNLQTLYLANNQNPYTYENLSCETWNWKICGISMNLKTVIENITNNIAKEVAKFEEGDTYFQRYNCFKTASKDLQKEYNNVTETASVMIESYSNLDGLYWEYNTLTENSAANPMVTPLYNKQKEINPVYSIQNDLCDTFKQIDYTYFNAELNHYPTEILWSLQKTEGEQTDSWGVVPATNALLISGEMGSINKLISYNENTFCLQDHGISILNYDPQVIQPTNTESTLSVYLTDATKLKGVTYLSRTIGTLNKWSVVLGHNGFYWMDETLKKIYMYGVGDKGGLGIIDLSLNGGFESWSKDYITLSNGVWNPSMFWKLDISAFKSNYDLRTGDVYWSNNNQCLCYNEIAKAFTSFYSYEHTPYKFTYLDNSISILNSIDSSTIWHDQITYTHTIYNQPYNAYVELMVNPSGLYDKVFNFIEYNTEAYRYVNGKWELFTRFNPYNYISVSNMYQSGEEDMDIRNTRDKFRLWRTALPRENGTIHRIRGPWCKIKLEYKPDAESVSANRKLEYKDKLYYINVNYTIPEQPLKTNIKE